MATFRSVLEQLCLTLGISNFAVGFASLLILVGLVLKKKLEINSTKIKSNYRLKFNQIKNRPINLNDYYDFMHAKRGIALIFNHENFINENCPKREGTKRDGDNLKAALEELKFEVRYYMDLKLHEIQNVLRTVSNEDHSNNDCLWVTVMSHGGNDGKIYSSDKVYYVKELWKNFLGDRCKSLIGKPKLFFIQACKGSMVDPYFIFEEKTDSEEIDLMTNETSNKHADLLVMYSTLDCCFSIRNKQNGSVFIQALCKEMQKMKENEGDLLLVLTAVISTVHNSISENSNEKKPTSRKQLPFIESTLTKTVVFFYESSNQELIHVKIITENIYDTSNAKRGIALIFNHEKYVNKNCPERKGTKKDADDLKAVLQKLQFDVRVHKDLKLQEIQKVLWKVSREDHSNNDCLLVAVMTHGGNGGKIYSSDKNYNVKELWENYFGKNCESLIGKPKLFFIQACRGSMVDPGVLLKPKKYARSTEQIIVIPKLADLLVMYSTTECHYALRDPGDGSWFIQALCEELKTNPQEDLLRILTGVNSRVAHANQSNVPGNDKLGAAKQIPNIQSMLTKLIFLYQNPVRITKGLCYEFFSAKRGIALIFNNKNCIDDNFFIKSATKKDADDLKAVLQKLQFDVRVHKDLKLQEIKNVLSKVSKEDHSNYDCLWVTIITHGREDGKIAAADEFYHEEELWMNFLGDNCKSLIGKPKLFFIQAGGGLVEVGVSLKDPIVPDMADLLVMHSSAYGHNSSRHIFEGAWFIQVLCEELNTNPQDDLMRILTRVNRRVALKIVQMPSFISKLTKTLNFPPKSSQESWLSHLFGSWN